MAGLTLSEASRAWGVHRDSVKRWAKAGTVEAAKDNRGVWRVREGQQPPPSAHSPSRVGPGAGLGRPGAGDGAQGSAGGGPGAGTGSALGYAGEAAALAAKVAELSAALAVAERDLAVSRRELELGAERLAELRELHRERVADLAGALARAEAALHRPSLLDRLLAGLGRLRAGSREGGR